MMARLYDIPRGAPGIALIAEAAQSLGLRCTCRVCLVLDGHFRDGSYQLTFFQYRADKVDIGIGRPRSPSIHQHIMSRKKGLRDGD